MRPAKRHATTVHLNLKVARAAKVKAAMSDKSLSDVVNEALVVYLRQDEEDLKYFELRDGEPDVSLDDVLKDLRREGLL
jgi:hypothetical protein